VRIERGFLRSRVARRIVSAFVLCALVPILATAVLSYDHVRKLLFDQSYLHLAQLGESYASALYERLSGVSLLLRQVGPVSLADVDVEAGGCIGAAMRLGPRKGRPRGRVGRPRDRSEGR